MLNRTEILTFFCQQSPSFLCQNNKGTLCCKEGMRVENLKQKVIRPGYEKNTEDFRQLRCSKMFSTVWLASPFVSLSWLPGVVLCQPSLLPELLLVVQPGSPWELLAFAQMKHLRHFIPVEHAFLGSAWLWMFCSPSWQTPLDLCPHCQLSCREGLVRAVLHPSCPCCHGSKIAISGTLTSFSDGGIGKHLCTGDLMVWHQCRVLVLIAWGFVCTLNTWPCEMRCWSCCTGLHWCNHDVNFFAKDVC